MAFEYGAVIARTQTHRHTDTQTHRHTDTQTHRHTDTQTDTDTQIDTDRHRSTQIDTDTEPIIYRSQQCNTRSGLTAGKIKGVVTVYNITINRSWFIISYHIVLSLK